MSKRIRRARKHARKGNVVKVVAELAPLINAALLGKRDIAYTLLDVIMAAHEAKS